ncbi:hypothetical protein JTB14_017318 [Gonioctena quinquepunctata]|nr:hypothetical protein JTB14_017318 [Gonioctena quinquepunctata]
MVRKCISCEEKFIENHPRSFHRFPAEPRRTQCLVPIIHRKPPVRTPPKITFDLPQFGAILPEESVEPARKSKHSKSYTTYCIQSSETF